MQTVGFGETIGERGIEGFIGAPGLNEIKAE